MPRLTSLSFAHPAVSAEERARVARLALADFGPAFVLITCLRVEFVTLGDSQTVPQSGVLGQEREGEEAFLYLCRVAAGLESPIAGEPEVLGQFRTALTGYRQSASCEAALVRALDVAVGVARRARRQLGETPRGSLAAVAAGLAEPFDRVAVLGSGAMASAAINCLNGKEVTLFARRAVRVGDRDALPWDEADSALRSFPVVISTYPGKAPVSSQLKRALVERATPLLLIDLGMPPAFGSWNDHVRYVGIDELAASADAQPSPVVEESLQHDARRAWHRLHTPNRTSEVIAALTAVADRAADEEVARFARRLRSTEDPERLLRQLAHTVARRVLHPPISYLGSSPAEAVEVLADAFGVDRE
ncbi:MAG: hypothetical protein ACRDVK_03055 [Acidimicrobiia bacterium]